MRFLRLLAPVALVAVLAMALTGCSGDTGNTKDTKSVAAKESTATAVSSDITDKRIIGIWKGEDGMIDFQANGEAVLADGSRVDFAVPSSERLEMKFQSGTQVFDIQWKSNDEHGVRLVGGKDKTFTYYVRQK